MSAFDAVSALVTATVARFGALDVMVNNAGIASEGTALDVSLDGWRRTIDTDLSDRLPQRGGAQSLLLKHL